MEIQAELRTAILDAVVEKFSVSNSEQARVEVLQRGFDPTFEDLPLRAQASITAGDRTPRYGVTIGEEKYLAMQRDDGSWLAIKAAEVPEFQFAK